MEKKDFRIPKNNHLRISKRKNVGKWVFLSKIYLKHFKEIELHALGDAINIAVRTAESLSRKGLCQFLKVDTQTVLLDRRNPVEDKGDAKEQSRQVKKHKVGSGLYVLLDGSWSLERGIIIFVKCLRGFI